MDSAPARPIRRLAALPVWRAMLALTLGLVCVLVLRLVPGTSQWPLVAWALLAGALAALAGAGLRLGLGWRGFVFLVPLALVWQLGQAFPGWVYPVVLGMLLLVFGGGLLTRVPLYNSNRRTWRVLAGLLPEAPGIFVDLGAGLGGPLAFLAPRRRAWQFRGVEASPLVWLVAWMRTRPVGCRMRLGSIWREDLQDVDVAYAFLSPAPMAELWAKVRQEMRPGTLLVSHSFEVPGVTAEQVLPLPGRPGACLRLYRVP